MVLLQYKYHFIQQIRQFLNTRVKQTAAGALALAVVATLAVGIYNLKKDSANGKLFIWEVTLDKIAEKPLFGYGVGRFEAEYNNWQAEYFQKHPKEMDGPKGWVAGNTKYAFNEYLEIISEIGIVGFLLFIGILTFILLGMKKNINGEKTQSDFSILKSALFGILICALLSFPFYSLPTLAVFFFLLAGISSYVKFRYIEFLEPFKEVLLVKYSAATILLVFTSWLTLHAYSLYNDFCKWHEADELYLAGHYSEACTIFEKICNQMQDDGTFLQYYDKALYMKNDYSISIIKLRRAQYFINNDVLYTTLGDCYKGLKNYNNAEKAYQYALNMIPHKLYPLYLLAKLYDETGEKSKAKEMAYIILNKDIKMESNATKEMKMEMKRILNSK